MFINSETARNLELVQNNLTMKDQNTLYCGFGATCDWATNRFATLDSCFTPMGKRLLRASILQPNNCGDILHCPAQKCLLNPDRVTVENRLDAVEGTALVPMHLSPFEEDVAPPSVDSQNLSRRLTSFVEFASISRALRMCVNPERSLIVDRFRSDYCKRKSLTV